MSPAKAVLRLLHQRAANATICPSEVARMIADPPEEWRERMAEVHHAVAALHDSGDVVLTWKGQSRSPGDGPYRTGRIAPGD